MKKLLREFGLFLSVWGVYLSHRGRLGFGHFENIKGLLVDRLTFGRGKMTRPFVHSGMATLVIVGMALTPLIATSYPGFAQSPWQETMPSSAVLSAATDSEQTATIISDKPRAEIVNYKVEPGDTVSSIAQKFGVSIDTIRWANDLSSISSIKPGQTLKILPVTGVVHKVAKGDTIYSIAKHYEADAQSVVDFPFNTFTNDETFALAVGQEIVVPDGVMPKVQPWSPTKYIARRTPDAGAVSAIGSFAWPTSGTITQGFRWYHMAVDIANRAAPAILAADNGRVLVAGWPDGSGYGNRVIIDHGNGYQTLYAHMQKIYVTSGQTVRRGDQLGQMGSTGRSTGTHLHFEIHRNGTKLDPLGFLK